MSNTSIQDIPRIKEMLDQAKSMQALKTISPVLFPLLRLMGVDVSQTKEALSSFEELQQTVEEMAAISDRFNELFGERGWIMYEQMNYEAALESLLGRAGKEFDLQVVHTLGRLVDTIFKEYQGIEDHHVSSNLQPQFLI